MKFMKKTKDRMERELANTQGHDVLYSKIITKEMRHASGNFISEPSFMFCEDLMEGRLSFKGMNPEIERLMELDQLSKEPPDDMKKDISDEILAKKFAALKRKSDKEFGPPSKKKK
ncbi:M-phase phosphoprotein 6 [Eumeta japonica]|uniref:M-phase phosphoprotein 6 n=1 Tax=Eumeta variegata TaxID=151549 RepID=A0A4C1Y5Z4_EUMVA|nr:M-phase phosphoprotein 6 [Eumeta japonica]